MSNIVALAPERDAKFARAIECRERRAIRARADRMLRAKAALYLQLDGLAPMERLVVLNDVLTEELRSAKETGVV
jgi:hypothetical protein